MTAKYYIYRNLRTGGFSVKYKGRVIDRPHTFSAYDVEFKVSEAGRQKVITEKQKNVHAFVVADKYKVRQYPVVPVKQIDKYNRVSYNPYKAAHFMCAGQKITHAKELVFQNGCCYIV